MAILNFSQACENNKAPILEQLKKRVLPGQRVLEVGSGSGQHAIHFGTALPDVMWQPTDQGDYYDGLKLNLAEHASSNVLSPHYLDMKAPDWPEPFDLLYSANVIHIMSAKWLAHFFDSSADSLMFYGPYKYNGEFTSESNARFDVWLKNRNPESGIRDIETLCSLAEKRQYQLRSDTPMPANNQFLVFSR